MSNTQPIIVSSLRKRGNLGALEIQALLDLWPEAALLVDTRDYLIVLPNNKATELTAFTRTELVDMDLRVLLPGLEEKGSLRKGIEPGESWDLMMVRRGGGKLEVQASLGFLDTTKKWAFLTLQPVSLREHRRAAEQRQQRLWEALILLMGAFQEANLEAALSQALQAGSALCGASILAIYQAEAEALRLRRIATLGQAELLPEQISPQDLISLKSPLRWVTGKRPLCDLHRIARTAKLSFVASTPLGDPNAIIGLVVASGNEGTPAEDVLPALGMLASSISILIQLQNLTNNLQSTLRGYKKSLTIGNALKDSIQDGIIIVASDLSILETNPSVELTLGYASQEVLGQPLEHILVSNEGLIPAIVSAQRGSDLQKLGNFSLYRRDGHPLLAQVSALPLHEKDQAANMAILLQDLSQEEQYRIRVQQLEQRAILGEVTSVFAHEVRNPINNISTGLQLMAMNLPDNDPNAEVCKRLQQDCDRLADLMKSVLAFARPIEPKMEPVDLGQLLRRLLERWHPQMARANIQHHLQIDNTTPPMLGDVRPLEQVFTNLINNTMQALSDNSKGGTLTLKVRPIKPWGEQEQVEVSVIDNGPGIPDEIRERIFEPFFTTRRGGTGLGLAITKRIVTAHRGTIQVTSIPGATVFQVRFPAAKFTTLTPTEVP